MSQLHSDQLPLQYYNDFVIRTHNTIVSIGLRPTCTKQYLLFEICIQHFQIKYTTLTTILQGSTCK